jgi:LemA protein
MKRSLVPILVIVGIIVVAVLWGIGRYNKLVTLEEGVTSSWSQVENVYQRRADLIPNLVNTVKGYAEFEQETLTQVIEARSKATGINVNAENLDEASIQQFQQAQQGLSSALSRLMVVVERYPDLKANQNFLELQSQLEGTENRITVERRNFTTSAQAFNTAIRRFPNSLFGFERKAYFAAEQGAEQAPEVQF